MNTLDKQKIYAVILGGGKGTRFWPLSRDLAPKQLLKIVGSKSMLEQTISRISPIIPQENICVVANSVLTSEIKNHLHPEAEEINFFVEPEGKNTAPAIGLAAIHVKKMAADPVMILLPADHFIEKEEEFIEILKHGVNLSLEGCIVTIGIKPLQPETGYGYIKVKNEKLEVESQKHPAYKVERFVEKPDYNTAAAYLKEGGYYWNSGMFIWKASTILNEIKTFMPDLYAGLMRIDEVIGTNEEKAKKEEVFRGLKPESIDYGVVEKSEKVVVIPADIGWSDVGSFSSLYDVSEKDEDENVVTGHVINLDTTGSIIYGSENRLLAVLGLKDTIVIDTDDATLVCPKDRAQDVKRIVDNLREKGSEKHVSHKTVLKSWGMVTSLVENDDFIVSKIAVKPGYQVSYLNDDERCKQWVVASGNALLQYDDMKKNLNCKESFFIPGFAAHILKNEGEDILEIIEIKYLVT